MLNINNTLESYLQNVEIKGNTIQNPSDLSNIKSVGDKVGDEELYRIPIVCCGKNLFNEKWINGYALNQSTGEVSPNASVSVTEFIKVTPGADIVLSKGFTTIFYDANKIKKGDASWGNKFRLSNDTHYIRFQSNTDAIVPTIVEYGVESTLYEPYKEHKITILSPCQLEKVGDVEDRIIEKDGVWGVEKNVPRKNMSDLSFTLYKTLANSIIYQTNVEDRNLRLAISNKFKYDNNTWGDIDDVESFGFDSSGTRMFLKILKTNVPSLNELGDYLKNDYIIYTTTNPKFIPLPHAQQVKLKTFANKTNISFECEVEGAIKADVAKSINASVKSNTQEIGKINNRILDLEGLKESQEMEYSTDKGYLVCKETKAGTVKDLKVKGKSLLNKIGKFNSLRWVNNESGTIVYYDEVIPTSTLEVGKTYTLIAYGFGKAVDPTRCVITDMNKSSMIYGNDYIFKFTVNSFTNPGIIHFYNGIGDPITEADYVNAKILLLEGDHTQSPPNGYFEGIASVGTGVDKIEVSSIKSDGNLFNGEITSTSSRGFSVENIDFSVIPKLGVFSFKTETKYNRNSLYLKANSPSYSRAIGLVSYNNGIAFGNYNLTDADLDIINENPKGMRIEVYRGDGDCDTPTNICINKGESPIPYQCYKEDKKTLLFKDTDGTWKPISELRGLDTVCDTIELHNDGKYYYHIRTVKGILDGTQTIKSVEQLSSTNKVYIDATSFKLCTNLGGVLNLTCDKLPAIQGSDDIPHIRTDGSSPYASLILWLDKSYGDNQESINRNLSSNPITFIGDLAEEKVFEVNPLFLESYENETMILCESGAVKPGMEWKITSYITNLVSTNTKRIKRIENDFYNYTVAQNRMMLSSRYNADRADFRIDNTLGVPKTVSVELDYDLFELMKKVVIVGKDNYDRSKIEEQMDFYVTEGFIDWDMWDELFAIIELQHNPPVDLIPIEPISIEEPKPKKSRRGRKKKLEEI